MYIIHNSVHKQVHVDVNCIACIYIHLYTYLRIHRRCAMKMCFKVPVHTLKGVTGPSCKHNLEYSTDQRQGIMRLRLKQGATAVVANCYRVSASLEPRSRHFTTAVAPLCYRGSASCEPRLRPREPAVLRSVLHATKPIIYSFSSSGALRPASVIGRLSLFYTSYG